MRAPRRILIVGSGGREHALAWRLARDPEPAEVLVAPGSEGLGLRFRRLEAGVADPAVLVRACCEREVDLVVVGPEAALAGGLADDLEAAGIAVFGPSRSAARLESSKWFAKELMREAGIPTARAEVFDDPAAARAALARFEAPWVIKADGLAGGKGVRVTAERTEAEAFVAACLGDRRFGPAGGRVLIEEFLDGEEASVMAVCDGRRFVLLPPARDYKRALDADRGGNTGGMGAYAPTPAVTPAIESAVAGRIVAPTLVAMERRGTPFRGILYCGLMLGGSGARVVEFNVRFGDPETEVVVPLVTGSLASLLLGAARGELDPAAIGRGPGAAVAVTLVDAGYPDAPAQGGRITGLDALEREDGIMVFHAATAAAEGGWRVAGGRAAHVVAVAADLGAARARAYAAVGRLGGAGWRCRSDIAAGPAAGAAIAAGRGAA
ncbi:MAG: phosphoribosylamine--glycine ligase [Candidatus Eisenbacteria bacterium RBG_16_71_46]|nr:MAG: phosphoribosylamine--glycine ligase [Candidatus Eisenbacteria bacterium RBG_16_71_46]